MDGTRDSFTSGGSENQFVDCLYVLTAGHQFNLTTDCLGILMEGMMEYLLLIPIVVLVYFAGYGVAAWLDNRGWF